LKAGDLFHSHGEVKHGDGAGDTLVVTIVFEPETKMAEGGTVSFMKAETGGAYYEVHVFNEPGEYTLEFLGAPPSSITAEYLIVAGGGGGGGSVKYRSSAGGGGAGGLLYGAGPLPLTGGSVAVTVGAGGRAGGISAFQLSSNTDTRGGNGGYSAIGTIAVPGGGGGGAAHASWSGDPRLNGLPGGSGGGGGTG
jgi:hypothetical protein